MKYFTDTGWTFQEFILPQRLEKIDTLLSLASPKYQRQAQFDHDHLPYDAPNVQLGSMNIDDIRATTQNNGGSTNKTYDSTPLGQRYAPPTHYEYNQNVPTTGYCVATHPDLGTWIEADATPEQIEAYIETFITRNADLLWRESDSYLGLWVSDNPETQGMIALDLVSIVPDKETAMALGREHNQQAIFDLESFESIDCGGTGAAFDRTFLLEKDVAANYVGLCVDYMDKHFMDEMVGIEDVLTQHCQTSNQPPQTFGFPFDSIPHPEPVSDPRLQQALSQNQRILTQLRVADDDVSYLP